MKVGALICDTQSNGNNMKNIFKQKYKLDMYEFLTPMFNPNMYTKYALQIGSMIKHITMIKDYWVNCKYEFKSHD